MSPRIEWVSAQDPITLYSKGEKLGEGEVYCDFALSIGYIGGDGVAIEGDLDELIRFSARLQSVVSGLANTVKPTASTS